MFSRISPSVLFAAVLAAGLSANLGEARADLTYSNLTQSDLQGYLDTYVPLGYRVRQWEFNVVKGEPRYFLVLRKEPAPYWQLRTGQTTAQFKAIVQALTSKGYTLKKHRAYYVNGQLLNASYFEKGAPPIGP